MATVWWGLGVLALMAGEAAFQPSGPILLVTGLVAWALAVWVWRDGSRIRLALALALGSFGLLALLAARASWRVRAAPERTRIEAVAVANAARDRMLATAIAGGRQVARYALLRAADIAPGRVPDLTDLLSSGELEQGVVVLGGDTVVALAGPLRVRPLDGSTAAALQQTPFARTLTVVESRAGRRAQVTLLLDRTAALPAPGPSLAERSRGWGRVQWQWSLSDSVLRFDSADGAAGRIRGAMTAVAAAPEAFVAHRDLIARWQIVIGLSIVAIVVLTGGPPLVRVAALLLPIWVIDRAGLAPPAIGAVALKAALLAAALLLLAIVLWRRPARRSPVGLIGAGILLAVAPLLVALASTRLAPPAEPDSIVIWFGWQAMLAWATAAYLLLASAPLRSTDDALSSGRWGWTATGAAVVVGGIGIVAWAPSGWPGWYLPLWLIPFAALLPVTSPFARRIGVITSAAILAALAAWGASLDQRMSTANADLADLAAPRDSSIIAPLEQFGAAVRAHNATRLPALYAAWHASPLYRIGAPTQLAVWSDTTVTDWVALDQLSASWDDLKALVRDPGPGRIVPLARGPGRHYAMVVPLSGDTAATVLIGPRSRLVRPTRFGRLVDWRSPAEPAYQLEAMASIPAASVEQFTRRGRFVRTTHVVSAGAAPLAVRATITMSTPRPFIVRAALTVILDVVLVLVAWTVLQRMIGASPRQRGSGTMFRRSYRRTIAAALMAFFVVPAAFFTLWSALRLRQDVGRDRAADVARALDGVMGDEAFDEQVAGPPTSVDLALIAERAGAEFGLYRGGRLVAASLDLLAELGVLPPVLDPEMVGTPGSDPAPVGRPIPAADVRASAALVGSDVGVAAVLPGVDVQLARDQIDLGLLLLLASLGGTLAAIAVATAVARALGQPIEQLRRRAIAIGRREAAPPLWHPPAEFEPVFTAIDQMERDLGESEARLEDETARTARIVAWGEMARQVAHEIKNPLTPMRLGLQHLRRLGADGRADLPAQVDATVERVLAEIDRLDRIARSFARYGAPPERTAGPLESIDLAEVTGELAELFRLAATSPRVEVTGRALEPVAARREELMQVVLNLIDNARAAGATRIALELSELTLRVSDDGSGIAPDQLERIFEPTFSTTTSGTGLGLAIVRRLVEGWGGVIAVRSVVGEGTTFEVGFAAGPPTGGTPAA